MQVSTKLREPFSLSVTPFIVLVIILVILIILYVILKNYKPRVKNPNIIIPKRKDRNEIKVHYLKDVNDLLRLTKDNKIDIRSSYQQLSSMIRHFIYEMTSIKVQNYTLEEIKNLNMPILYELVSEYYKPEFDKISEGDVVASIEKTRKVIARWN